MFQNLRVNSQLYVLHKENTPYVETGSVVSVSAPRPKYPTMPQVGQFPQVEMVVDVIVNIGGQNTKFQDLPAGSDIADFGNNGNVVVSCSRDAMNNEVAMMKQKSIDVVNSVGYHEKVIESCDKMLNLLNPEFAAKQQQDEEISGLKKQVSEMTRNMSELMAMNKKLMEQLGIGTTKNE